MIIQVFYYENPTDEIVGEITPLIQTRLNNNSTLQSRRRKRIMQFLAILSLSGVLLTGAAYLVSNRPEVKNDSSLWILNESKPEMKLLPQIFGWISALLYRK